MARDYASKQHRANRGRPTARKQPATRRADNTPASPVWQWYVGGVVTGILLSFLVYLGALPPTDTAEPADTASADTEQGDHPKPRFDFYTMLPRQTLEIETGPRSPRITKASEHYLLQAGSFRQQTDADRRRAELLLLGLDPRVEEASGDSGRWYRVYLGPFASKTAMTKARSLTAGQDIDTLLLKRGSP